MATLAESAKAGPKTMQSVLRHRPCADPARPYTQGDGEETRSARGDRCSCDEGECRFASEHARLLAYCSRAYSALAATNVGTSASASFWHESVVFGGADRNALKSRARKA